ncbi:MAG: SctF chaperone SctG [Parachlamydia sp.]|jgi:Flp pilus assembly protein TadD|nr:SctF chaperone SctG [Parachlamydia sp.]
MEAEKISDFKEDFALLIEAGFVAVKQLDETSGTRIFHAAQALSPHSTAPQIGLGYIALNKLEIKEATRIFEGVLQSEPDNHLAQTFLGMCCLLTKGRRKKGEKLIHEAIEKSSDPTIKNLGTISLEWSDKDLTKKTKAPFFSSSSAPQEDTDEDK